MVWVINQIIFVDNVLLICVIECFDFLGARTLQKEKEVVEVAQVEEALLGAVEEAEVEEAKVEEGMGKTMMGQAGQIHTGAEAGDMTKVMMVLTPTL